MLVALLTMGTICACGDDDDGESQGDSGYGYAEMDGHKSSFKYAYYSQYEYEYFIYFTTLSIQEMYSNPRKDQANFRLSLNSRVNPDLKNLSIGSITEGTIMKGIGFEYQPYATMEEEEYVALAYISGLASNLEKTTVTITKTGTNRYRIVAKDQVYLVQENGHGVSYKGDKPAVRTVIGNFEWEGPIVDLKTVIPEEYWDEEE